MRTISIVVLVLALIAVAADRVSLVFAQRATAGWLAGHASFDRTPSVRIHGVPFLTQVVGGSYRDVEVRGEGLRLGDISGASLDAHLRGVQLKLTGIFAHSVDRLPCAEVDGSVTLPYAELARLANVPGLTFQVTSAGVRVSAALPIPGAGSVVAASGLVAITLEGTSVRLSAQQVTVAGASLPPALAAQLAKALTVSIAVPPLPYGLELTGIHPAGAGVVLTGSARNVVLRGAG